MKRALITGITGQDGSYLAEFLLRKGYEVYGIQRRASTFNTGRIDHIYDIHPGFLTLYGDLCDASSVAKIIRKVMPDEVYNLGAQSHVRVSFDVPEYTANSVGLGTLRLLEAIKEFCPKAKFYQASSSEMFGKIQENPQTERTPFYPRSPYACAKLFGYWIARNYRESYNLFTCNGILFNHESPRRGETFVTRKITRAVVRIKEGVQEVLYLGNLDAKRDWGHARDYIRAMWMMLQQDHPEDYVIATGETHSIREFLVMAFKQAGIDIVSNGKKGLEEEYIRTDNGRTVVKIDSAYFRPAEVNLLLGDSSKAREKLGWKPEVKFKELVSEMVKEDYNELKKMLYGVKMEDKKMENKKILVLGSTGFVGKRVCKKLKQQGIEFSEASLSQGADFRDLNQIKRLFEKEKPTHVLNCAAFVGGIQFGLKHVGEIYFNNTLMSLNIFECAKLFNVKRVVNPISNCSYPNFSNEVFTEERWWDGKLHDSVLSYGFTRKASWVNSWAYNKQYGIDTINLLVPNMYGPEDHFEEERSHALGALIMKIYKAKQDNKAEVTVWGTGKPIREWLYVDDFADLMIEALDIEPTTKPINVGIGKGISIKEMAEIIKDEVGFKGRLVYDTSKPDGAPYKIMDVRKMEKILKKIPKTGMKEGIGKTVRWYEKEVLK